MPRAKIFDHMQNAANVVPHDYLTIEGYETAENQTQELIYLHKGPAGARFMSNVHVLLEMDP